MTDRRRDAVEFLAACTEEEFDALLREARGDNTNPPTPADHEPAYPTSWLPNRRNR